VSNGGTTVARIASEYPGSNDVGLSFHTFNGSLTEAMRIDKSGLVSIGKTSSDGKALELYQASYAALRIQNATTSTGAGAGLLLEAGGSDVHVWNYETGYMRFGTDDAERMRILAAGGLTFNGDTAAANALDDYEEGTWTPGIKFGTTAADVTNTATYTKVGRMVHCVITAMRPTNFNGGTGNIRVTGLPFTNSASYGYGTIQGSPMSMAAGESFIQVYVEAGTTCRLLVQFTTAHADITNGDCATTTKFYGSFTYFV
jgi:hypothetical protein